MTSIKHYRSENIDCEDLITHLREWFVNQDFEVQALKMEDGADLLQVAKKGNKWKRLAGLSSALNVVIRNNGSDLELEVGAGKWLDKAVVGTISLFVLWPLAFTAAFGAWRQMKMPERTFSFVSEYIESPHNTTIYIDDDLEKVQAATEMVQVPHGTTVKVTRSRTIEHNVDLSVEESVEESCTQMYTDFLSQSVKEKIEQKLGLTYSESETVTHEVALDGNESTSYMILWIDSFCKGVVEYSHSNKIEKVPFKFRVQTDLQVCPGE